MNKIEMLDLHAEYRHMKREIDDAISRCLDHQHWILGPEVGELERGVAALLDCPYTVGVSNGSDALVLALRALSLSRTGREYFSETDEIITTPFTFTATGDSILRARATPVFIDIDPLTFNIDLQKVRQYLVRNKRRPVGILPVHLYGAACDCGALEELAREFNLFIVEDCAQAIGTRWDGRCVGTFGDLGCFSFFPSKNLGAFGDAGMLCTSDPALEELIRMLLKHGGKDKYNVEHIGYNARLDTLQAAILVAKLKYLEEFTTRRRELAKRYEEELQGIPFITTPAAIPRSAHVYHQYTLRVGAGGRDSLQRHLAACGIATMVYYPVPLHQMKVFQGRSRIPAPLTAAELACSEVLSLPIEPLMSRAEQDLIIASIRNFRP